MTTRTRIAAIPLAAVAVLALAGCSDPNSAPTTPVVTVNDEMLPGTQVNWRPEDAIIDGATLTLKFIGGRPFDPTDPCTETYTADVTESNSLIQVELTSWRPAPNPADSGVGCAAQGYEREVSIQLDAPIGDRQLVSPPLD